MARKGPEPKPVSERFWPKVNIQASDECWEWQAQIITSGYGMFTVSPGNQTTAHRIAYELTFGPIPEGMLVCHHCDNRTCVNPFHLFVGTHKDNYWDMVKKGRRSAPGTPGERNHFSILTEVEVKKIRNLLGKKSHSQLATIFGVSKSAITAISTRQSWFYLED